MRILSITAGAAGMYCGSCFRDNALAAELLARGHDVTLMPVYTPTRTDEPNVSSPRVLFGGISVYLQHTFTFFRHLPRPFDRILDSPRVISALANRSATTDPRLLGGLTISTLRGRDGVLRREFDKLMEWARDQPPPDVINLPNSLLISMAAPLRQAFRRPVCCTLQGEELFLDGLIEPYRSEARSLIRDQIEHVDRFVAVSEYCADFMSGYLEIPRHRISMVPLGISFAGYERRLQAASSAFRIGYFARVAPEKGLHVLADAYVRFRGLVPDAPARLEAAGYLASTHVPYLDSVRTSLEAAGLGREFTYHGELDRARKLAFLQQLDLLSVPATYDEPKGMFLLEAMASGVPVVQPRRGAFTEVVERTGGGVLVEPDDTESLAQALAGLWRDGTRRAALSDCAFRGVREHYAISRSADLLMRAYEDIVARAPAA